MTEEEIKALTYDEALAKLEEISKKLENKEVSIDNLTKEVKLANMLSEYCKEKLNKTEDEIRKIIKIENKNEDSVPDDDLPFS